MEFSLGSLLGNGLENFNAATQAWDAIAHPITSIPLDLLQINPDKISDPVADFRNWVNYFIKSGQVWALLIGMGLGWFVRGIIGK